MFSGSTRGLVSACKCALKPSLLRAAPSHPTFLRHVSIISTEGDSLKQPKHNLHSSSKASKEQTSSSTTPCASKLVGGTNKKLTRRKRPLTATYKSALNESGLVAKGIALCETFDLTGIAADKQLNQNYQITLVDDVVDTAIYLTPKLTACKDTFSELFVFSDGVVVYWNISSQEQASISSSLLQYQTDPHANHISEEEAEKMPFKIVEKGKSSIKQDTLLLSMEHNESNEVEPGCNGAVLERYAFSHAIAISTKISMWEQELNEQAEPLFAINKAMTNGKIICNHKQVVENIGRFAGLKHSIHLTDLLSDDFYWERPDLEKHYNNACRYFITQRRLSRMDARLNYCGETLQQINELLAHNHSSRLEWLIIWLIVIEVFFDFFHFFDHASPKPVYMVPEPKENN